MKLLYGTGNPAKAAAMQNRIAGLGIELISLQDLQAQGVEIPDVPETGNTPLENARQKAHAYYEAFRFPVIPGCILKMSRRRSSPGYMCVR